MAADSFRPPSKCRVPSLERFANDARVEVRRCMTQLQADGWSAIEIAETVGTSRTELYRWRNGSALPDYAQFMALKSLAAEQASKRRTG